MTWCWNRVVDVLKEKVATECYGKRKETSPGWPCSAKFGSQNSKFCTQSVIPQFVVFQEEQSYLSAPPYYQYLSIVVIFDDGTSVDTSRQP